MHRSEGVVYTIEAAAFRTAEGCCLCIAESMYPLGSKGILPCRRTRWLGMTACIGFCPWYHQMTCRAGRRDGSVKNSTGESAAALPHRSYHFTGEIPDRRLLEINEGAIPRNRRLHGNGAVHNVGSGKHCLDFPHKKRAEPLSHPPANVKY